MIKVGAAAKSFVVKRWKYLKNKCSFHGDSAVLTDIGHVPLNEITTDLKVWSKDEVSGTMDWKPIQAILQNQYPDTVEIDIEEGSSEFTQTILSNKIHPFFVQRTFSENDSDLSYKSNNNEEGHYYSGPIENGYWVDAEHLQYGDRLLTNESEWATVTDKTIEPSTILAYNLTVADYHTYFVRGGNGEDASSVWVHNKCGNKKGSARTEPTLPPKTIVKDGEVKILH